MSVFCILIFNSIFQMFCDCFPSLVVSPECVVVKQRIGDGGFGTVYSGAIINVSHDCCDQWWR